MQLTRKPESGSETGPVYKENNKKQKTLEEILVDNTGWHHGGTQKNKEEGGTN